MHTIAKETMCIPQNLFFSYHSMLSVDKIAATTNDLLIWNLSDSLKPASQDNCDTR